MGFGFASLHNVCVCVLRGELDVARVRVMRAHSQRVHDEWGEKRVNLTIVEGSAVTDVSREVRVESGAIMRDFPSALNVIVVEGRGFRNSAARAILAAMALLAGRRLSNRVFDDAREAAEWMVPRVPAVAPPPTVEQILALVDTARRAIGAR